MSEPETETPAPTETSPAEPTPPAEPQVPPDGGDAPEGTPEAEPNPPGGPPADVPAEEPEQPDTPPAETTAPPASEKELEKASRSLERSVNTYTDAVARYIAVTGEKIWRDPLSSDKFPGYFYSPEDLPLNEDQQAALRLLLGMEMLPNLKPDPLSHRCDTCDGHGQTDTKSQVQGERYVTCPVCDGHGFVGERLERIKRAGRSVAPTTATVDEHPSLYNPPMDTWGTPLGHPGFGTPPDKWLVEWFDVPGAAHSHSTSNALA